MLSSRKALWSAHPHTGQPPCRANQGTCELLRWHEPRRANPEVPRDVSRETGPWHAQQGRLPGNRPTAPPCGRATRNASSDGGPPPVQLRYVQVVKRRQWDTWRECAEGQRGGPFHVKHPETGRLELSRRVDPAISLPARGVHSVAREGTSTQGRGHPPASQDPTECRTLKP